MATSSAQRLHGPGPSEHEPVQDGHDTSQQPLIYGTAWKGEDTADLVYKALRCGFRAISTAAQPRHYRQDLVGQGIERAIQDGVVTREDVFIQTTFTPSFIQDAGNMPYDPETDLESQVRASITSSIASLGLANAGGYLDAVLLHQPYPDPADTALVWAALASHLASGHIRQLGVSNITAAQLSVLPSPSPAIVQNRFHPAVDSFDARVRAVCAAEGITYQTFGVLRNERMLRDEESTGLVAREMGVSRECALYALVVGGLDGDVRVLCGTTSAERMETDLMGVDKILRSKDEGVRAAMSLFGRGVR